METKLSNVATVLGNYNDIPTSITSEVLLVTMIKGLTVTKSSDKQIWADGLLTYTITVNNETSVKYTSPVISDTLDINNINLIEDSIMINGNKAQSSEYTYDSSTGELTINLSDLEPSEKSVVSFQVAKKS